MEGAVARADRERPIGFIGLMRNRNYALLWWGQLVSEVGNRFHWVAVSLWVYSVTGSAGSVSLAVASMFVGSLLVGPWAGVLVDRWDRRKILVASDLVRGVLVALIPPLMSINVWLVYADLILISVATAFFRPAMFAVVPTVVGQKDLLAANSFLAAMETGTEIFGPALAGVLALARGYSPLLYIDATTYFISGICMLGLRLQTVREFQIAGRFGRQMVEEILEGFRYIRSQRVQWQLFLLIFPAVLVGAGLNALQTPLAKGEVGIDDAQFGAFQSVWGVGFVVASLLLGWFGHGIPRSVLIVSGFLLGSVLTAVMGLSASFEALLLSGFAVGFANTLNYVGMTTAVMHITPRYMLGRVISIRQAALSGVRVGTPLLFGFLADAVGVRWSIVLMAIAGFVGTSVVAFIGRALWEMDFATPTLVRSRTWSWLVGSYSSDFDEVDQVRLNIYSLLVAVVGLAMVAFRSVQTAVGFIGWGLGVIVMGALARRLGTGRGLNLFERLFAYRRHSWMKTCRGAFDAKRGFEARSRIP